jgi:hypothetical protein
MRAGRFVSSGQGEPVVAVFSRDKQKARLLKENGVFNIGKKVF